MQLPEDFIRETRLLMGEDRFNRFLGAFDEEAPVSIRINPRYSRSEECGVWSEKCSEAESAPESNLTPHSSLLTPQIKVPWCPEGFYLSGRPQFTFDPLFHAGCYYVQEAASMFVTHILRAVANSSLFTLHSSLNVLDLCAAPGGKSTAMRTVLPEGSILVSNEPNPTRAQILLENITKWGWPDCIVTNNYPRDFRKAKAKFDLILCDVPCSGEGMFRKDPQAISEWSLQNVEKCWRLQREIVADAWECLNPGGLLIYSTCTFNIKEDEENVRWILDTYDAEPLTIPTDPSWNITGSLLPGFDAPVYRFIPGITRSEGLFMCVLRKSPRKEERGMRKENTLTIELLQKNKCLKIMDIGNLLPHSSFLFPRIDLPYSDALKYLRGEALVLPPDTPQGIVTVTYKGAPLGPVKNIGSRANNLYPKPWRIKTTHLPTEPVVIICKP
jgi:16S rRNA C967 or C1407 C5-methylase (RsmB/RsmF family)